MEWLQAQKKCLSKHKIIQNSKLNGSFLPDLIIGNALFSVCSDYHVMECFRAVQVDPASYTNRDYEITDYLFW